MRVAVCSNDYGTRLQLERLLKREADGKIAAGITFYHETFGSPDSMLAAPANYDLYIINYRDSRWDNAQLELDLRRKGVDGPIHFIYGDLAAITMSQYVEEATAVYLQKKQALLDVAKPAKRSFFSKIRIF